MNKQILIIDDELSIRMVLSRFLGRHGYEIALAEDGFNGLEILEEYSPDLILLDLKMPKMDGMETLRRIAGKDIPAKVIIMTAFGTIPGAVKALKEGAFDYITKPFDNDELLIVLEKALQHQRIERELTNARSRLDEKFAFEGIITSNSRMQKLLKMVRKIAPLDTAVLITGESGTGKELFAQAIHQNSGRKDKSFIPINCSTLPGTLIESELFGFKKGAFSGAERDKPGLIEQAHRGTLFLDEIGDMGMDTQSKILRFAQSGEFIPLGSTQHRTVDARIIAATNKDLEHEIAAGSFRSDLYYRLNVVDIHIPPLRERVEDIALLAAHFLRENESAHGRMDVSFNREAVEMMQVYHWPGNVRELENVVNRCLALSDGQTIGAEVLPESLSTYTKILRVEKNSSTMTEQVSTQTAAIEKKNILEALEHSDGNKTRACKELGISRSTLFRRMRKYGIEG
jgi:two-component system NtrC family response regulator